MTHSPTIRHILTYASAAGLLYTLMIFGPLAELTRIAGHTPLDLRPLGYTATEVHTLFSALGTEGRTLYLWRQLPLDMIYPLLLAATLMSLLTWSRPPLILRVLGRGLILIAAGADYFENIGIGMLLLNWPDLSLLLVRVTASASVIKALSTTLAVVLTLLAVVITRRSTGPKDVL